MATFLDRTRIPRFGGINPDEDQLRACSSPREDGPLQFVNLLSYTTEAQYPEGHELARAGLSGAEAYGRYGAVALDHVVRRAVCSPSTTTCSRC